MNQYHLNNQSPYLDCTLQYVTPLLGKYLLAKKTLNTSHTCTFKTSNKFNQRLIKVYYVSQTSSLHVKDC